MGVALDSLDELEQLLTALTELAPTPPSLKVNLCVARGLDYYTGMVFEADVAELGSESQVLGGGSYRLLHLFDLDEFGYGVAVYSFKKNNRVYSLICFANELSENERSDRVIATKWDAAFTLHDGVPTKKDIERLKNEVPKQEVGRLSYKELTLSRANKSVRIFDHVVESLSSGIQPDINLLSKVGYLYRTTAVYGSGKFGFPFWNMHPADWKRVLDVNLMGAVNVAHAFSKVLRANLRDNSTKAVDSTLLFIASIAGQMGSQTDPPYSAAKAGLINFMQVVAKDLAPFGIRANAISPGMIQTSLTRSVWQAWNDQQAEHDKIDYKQWGQDKLNSICPLARWQTPEEIAATALFLASTGAANITGQTINVDGGIIMHS